ncbi:hypothetical protein RRG08_063002 [Elysia crispata]|uniref:Uncharacterized protein n=1 Tax=Elysia crispata TaxID=231223 RepID=A0AAE1D0I1_9GAST|nr:hypothetical protein RRG08_063002 [Elysia crispata]
MYMDVLGERIIHPFSFTAFRLFFLPIRSPSYPLLPHLSSTAVSTAKRWFGARDLWCESEEAGLTLLAHSR